MLKMSVMIKKIFGLIDARITLMYQSSDAGWRGPLVSGPFCGPNEPFGTGLSDSGCFGLLRSTTCKAGNFTSSLGSCAGV